MKRFLWIFLSLFLMLVVGVIALPTLVSQKPVHDFLLVKYNERIEGKVQLESFSLGWTTGFVIKNLEIFDAKSRPVLQIAEVSFKEPIHRLLSKNPEISSLVIQKPQITLIVEERDTVSLTQALQTKKRGPTATPEKSREESKRSTKKEGAEPPVSKQEMDVNANIAVHDGSIVLLEHGETVAVSSLEMLCELHGTKVADISLSCNVLKNGKKGSLSCPISIVEICK